AAAPQYGHMSQSGCRPEPQFPHATAPPIGIWPLFRFPLPMFAGPRGCPAVGPTGGPTGARPGPPPPPAATGTGPAGALPGGPTGARPPPPPPPPPAPP